MLESFRITHRKLAHVKHISCWSFDAEYRAKILRHVTDFKHAWRNGMRAARQLLRGTLSRELHTVLGVAQLASAIRNAVDYIDLPVASEGKFLADLGRWRQLLPSRSHEAFDYYADVMWDTRPPSNLAWREPHDAETLVYFQDQLKKMLSLMELSPFERATPKLTFQSSNTVSDSPSIATTLSSLPDPMPDQIRVTQAMPVEISSQDEPMPMTPGEVVLYSAGAIFALILTLLLRKF